MTEVVQPPLDGLEPPRDTQIPGRPTPTAILRGRCLHCAQWPTVNELSGMFDRHNYPKRDHLARRGRCPNTGRPPVRMVWAEPLR